MENLVEINNEAHKNLVLNPAKAEAHGANLRLIPAVVPEFTNLAVQYPIVLTKNEETGEFTFAAMLGFDQEENLFWENNQWQGIYLPLQVQRQPFFLGKASERASKGDAQDYVVCIDTNSPMISKQSVESDPQLQKVYTDSGAESEYFQQSKQCLSHLLQGELDNAKLLDLLKQFDLLQPLSLEVTFVNEQRMRLNGLYTINQDKLAALTNEHVITLHKSALLQPIYTMIASLGQVYALIERKNEKITSAKE